MVYPSIQAVMVSPISAITPSSPIAVLFRSSFGPSIFQEIEREASSSAPGWTQFRARWFRRVVARGGVGVQEASEEVVREWGSLGLLGRQEFADREAAPEEWQACEGTGGMLAMGPSCLGPRTGRGVVALRRIEAGVGVGEYAGKSVRSTEARGEYAMALGGGWCRDASQGGNWTAQVQHAPHRGGANLVSKIARDKRYRPYPMLQTKAVILPGEELFFDYHPSHAWFQAIAPPSYSLQISGCAMAW